MGREHVAGDRDDLAATVVVLEDQLPQGRLKRDRRPGRQSQSMLESRLPALYSQRNSRDGLAVVHIRHKHASGGHLAQTIDLLGLVGAEREWKTGDLMVQVESVVRPDTVLRQVGVVCDATAPDTFDSAWFCELTVVQRIKPPSGENHLEAAGIALRRQAVPLKIAPQGIDCVLMRKFEPIR